jgi:hypothetical protein
VSARQTGGAVCDVVIESTAGGNVHLVSPWSGSAVEVIEQLSQRDVAVTVEDAFVSFPTETGKTYHVKRK